MENMPPSRLAVDNPPVPHINLSRKATKHKPTVLASRSNAVSRHDTEPFNSGLLSPPASQNNLEGSSSMDLTMEASKMLISPPPEELLRSGARHSLLLAPGTSNARALSPSTSASSKRKRTTPVPSLDHQQRPNTGTDGTAEIEEVRPGMEREQLVEATPNPKPRKQKRRSRSTSQSDSGASQGSPTRATFAQHSGPSSSSSPVTRPRTPGPSSRKSMSPTKRVLLVSPHAKNPNADYVPPVPIPSTAPVIRRQSIISRRSATPIPAYEPPPDRFTPPREIICTPTHITKVSKSSKRKSTTKDAAHGTGKGKAKGKGREKPLSIKMELFDVDLSKPLPPASPTDDPLLLSGPPRRLSQMKNREVSPSRPRQSLSARRTPPMPSTSPERPTAVEVDANQVFDVDAEDIQEHDVSMDISHVQESPSTPIPALHFDFSAGGDGDDGWSDSDDGQGVGGEGEGEYTGKFRMMLVRTKMDPPTSGTKSRMDSWGRPISPYPGSGDKGKRRAVLPVCEEDGEGGEERREVVGMEEVDDVQRVDEVDGLGEDAFGPPEALRVEESHEHAEEIVEEPDEPPESFGLEYSHEAPPLDEELLHDQSFGSEEGVIEHPMDEERLEPESSLLANEVTEESMVLDEEPQLPVAEDDEFSDGPFPPSIGEAHSLSEEVAPELEAVLEDAIETTIGGEIPEDHDQSFLSSDWGTDGDENEAIVKERFQSEEQEEQEEEESINRELSQGLESDDEEPEYLEGSPHALHSRWDDPQPSNPAEPQAAGKICPELFSPLPTQSTPSFDYSTSNPSEVVHQLVALAPGSDDEDFNEEADLSVVKITSSDPKAAARAAAILKQHDYEWLPKNSVKRRRHSQVTLDTLIKDSRRKGVSDAGVQKKRRRSTLGGVIGDTVFMTGTPTTTLPALLKEAELDLDLEQSICTTSTPSFSKYSVDGYAYQTPLPNIARAKKAFDLADGPMEQVSIRPSGEWSRDDWKTLDACFTDERLAVGARMNLGSYALADVDDIELENVVSRYLEYIGGEDVLLGLGSDWDWENLLARAQALRKKQKSGKAAPPTPSGHSAYFSPRLSFDVPDFTPIHRRSGSRAASVASEASSRVPPSLLAPRYSHLMEEAVAISRGDPQDRSLDNASTRVEALPTAGDGNLRPKTIGTRMKGLLFSYLPTLSKSSKETSKPKPRPAHGGLPLPPPEILEKPRGPIATPVPKLPPKPTHPKELVHLQPAPLPPKPSLIPRASKPRRLVELRPPPPRSLPPPAPIPLTNRRSSGGSVKDLVKNFEIIGHQQSSEHENESMTKLELKRMKSVEGWRKNGKDVDHRPSWKP
ncbi:hypothetical protein JAAARDRAFT_67866 [Jaapia argillacea MUCL 33604]|uniref:Uncharacterized protein n=1 Tax=Jaapia argillacea MUCL 33604 TaxID=933084 RepID=A0A067Q9W0_9AGAM|nr:hypothetical protein JAAARDRAFT_67866 [Jaapia argillacea MUCL 33604]